MKEENVYYTAAADFLYQPKLEFKKGQLISSVPGIIIILLFFIFFIFFFLFNNCLHLFLLMFDFSKDIVGTVYGAYLLIYYKLLKKELKMTFSQIFRLRL